MRAASAAGWAADDQLIEPGLVAVSVPVRAPRPQGGTGRVVCAVNVISHTSRSDAASLRDAVLDRLRSEVPAMEAALAERGANVGEGVPAGHAEDPRGPPSANWAPGSSSRSPGAWPSCGRSAAPTGRHRRRCRDGRRYVRHDPQRRRRGDRAAARHRAPFLLTLAALGYAEADGRYFRPLPSVLALGYAHLSGLGLPDIAQPHVRALVGAVRESASLAVLDGATSGTWRGCPPSGS
ncbi:hypothetical protein NKH77_39195 [Streptomyces sp. M19]